MKQEIPRLSLDDRARLLQAFHPDFRPGGMTELAVGPSKGCKIPTELAAILQCGSSLKRTSSDPGVADICVDVLVVGGGGAGASAALLAEENGAKVLLTTKLRFGDSNTIMAEGGIAAASRPGDSPDRHFLDTMGGGRFANSRELVRTLVEDAPEVLRWLRSLGVMFDFSPEEGLVASFAGGHSRKRVHSCKDLSGMEMMRVLRDEVRNRGIRTLEFHAAVELLLDEDGYAAGAVLQNLESEMHVTVHAPAVILATGGIGRLHIQRFPTTNHYGATADGLVLGYRAGASLVYMDSIQYHPTGIVWPEQMLGQLVTEALRGNGTHLTNCDGQRFINELETRDVTSSAILRECEERHKGICSPTGHQGVWLDTPMIDMLGGQGKMLRLFAGICNRFGKYGIDPINEPILVFPTQHYQNGGLRIDSKAQTDVPGLFAAGEVAGGVHGRNRLGGNSLVDIFVFGRRAGIAAAQLARDRRHSRPSLAHLDSFTRELQEAGIAPDMVSPIVLPDYSIKPAVGRSPVGCTDN
jgi:succinate dehydrogenase / fumarate reductase flavoprotein subunit